MSKEQGDTLGITFAKEIPSITRQGGRRSSKYDPLFDAARAAATTSQPVVGVPFATPEDRASKLTGIRVALARHEDAQRFTVASRTVQGVPYVYVTFDPAPKSKGKVKGKTKSGG